MKRSLILILSAIALSACGRAPVLEVGEFAPYVERFEQTALELGSPVQVMDLQIRFGEVQKETENAVCEIRSGQTPVIIVNPLAWERLSEVDREALMFHEMGHCVLRRKHVQAETEEGVPVSLMNPYRIDTEVYVQNEQHYLQELFDSRNEF